MIILLIVYTATVCWMKFVNELTNLLSVNSIYVTYRVHRDGLLDEVGDARREGDDRFVLWRVSRMS